LSCALVNQVQDYKELLID